MKASILSKILAHLDTLPYEDWQVDPEDRDPELVTNTAHFITFQVGSSDAMNHILRYDFNSGELLLVTRRPLDKEATVLYNKSTESKCYYCRTQISGTGFATNWCSIDCYDASMAGD